MDEKYAFLDCPNCGVVGITEEQYSRQMDYPDALWRCPHCREEAEYNDRLSEAAQGIYEE